MSQKIKPYFIVLFTLTLLTSLAAPVLAQEQAAKPWFQLVPEDCTKSTPCPQGKDADCAEVVNKCGVSAMFETIIRVSNLILMLTGSVALLMFMYGGARWILAAGKQEWVQAGTAAMTAAVVGLVIILTSWLIVNFTIIALTDEAISGQAQIFDSQFWFQEQ